MSLKIIWSDFAEKQLDEIYEYYLKEASQKVAKKIVRDIILEPDRLVPNPYLGVVEELLSDKKEGYRYIIYTNYKIIYSVNEESGFIKIAVDY